MEGVDTILVGIGGLLGGVAIIVVAFKKITTMFSVDSLTSTSSSVQSNLIKDLGDEIERVKTELTEMKKEYREEIESLKELHQSEKQQWVTQLRDLEFKFEFLKRRNESMRNEAVEAYTYIRTNEDIYGAEYAAELKDRLMKIIVQDSDHKSILE